MKDRKRRFETFSFYDRTGIEAHLKKMAEKGWMISEMTTLGWIYKRVEPESLTFAVSYYPKASEFDPEPTEGQNIYHDLSSRTGWQFVCSSAQMQEFCTTDDKPIPIETDPALEVEMIHRSAKKGFLLSYYILLAVGVLNGALFISRLLGDPIGVLASPICLMVQQVFVYPQAYAAVVPQAEKLRETPRTFVVDIGGYTTDVLLLRTTRPDMQFCRSLELGVIDMNNAIIGKVSALHDIQIEDDHIADIIMGRPSILPQEVQDTIFSETRSYSSQILDKLRELKVDLRATPAIFIGGGAALFRNFIESSPMVAHADFIPDQRANAIGYGMLANAQLSRMQTYNGGGDGIVRG